jgi:hypothetical protein
MFTSLLTGWFARPAEGAALGDRPPSDAPALPARRAPRSLGTAVQVDVSQTADGMVVRVKGEALEECAGALLDGLLAPAACRPGVVTLDLSELRSLSCLAPGRPGGLLPERGPRRRPGAPGRGAAADGERVTGAGRTVRPVRNQRRRGAGPWHSGDETAAGVWRKPEHRPLRPGAPGRLQST